MVAFSEVTYPRMYQKFAEGIACMLTKNFQMCQKFKNLETGLHLSVRSMVEAINTLNEKKYKASKICITVKVSRGLQKIEMYLAKKKDWCCIFQCALGTRF